ncbi:MAG: isoleucine--tRNA ligase [Capsulimonas sp.]|uniref:isoleucine--tRNA ligase n=1 Tax=Capsulimonas sp. TaxID=2494211 RepID=UPI0032670EEC
MTEPEKKPDYSQTLNVPKPDVKNPDGVDTNALSIPLRANLAKREPAILDFWKTEQVYAKSLESPPLGTFILHDGPPFSNGNIHIGHAFNKILKDVIMKFRSMQGYATPYIPGWDNNGLPIEVLVAKEFREKNYVPTPVEIRERCREVATEWVGKQSEQFQRLGIRGDWARPYLTMTPKMAAKQLEVFADMVEKGYIYRGLKPVYWSLVDETALAEAEIEYKDVKDPSIYVRFGLRSDRDGIFGADADASKCYTVIWTTTPWTIPANVAVAAGPDIEYAVIEHEDRRYLVAADRLGVVMAAANFTGWKVLSTHKGADLKNLIFEHPLFNRVAPLVLADYVTTGDGTGVVHTAPGHGKDDFLTGQKYNLPVLQILTGDGYFNEDAGAPFTGLRKKEGAQLVLDNLAEAGALLALEEILHSYPHGWRSKDPLVFRATVQWFVNIDHNGHREKCLKAIEGVKWYPKESIDRMRPMVAGRPDWCISRQRSWGVGIPVFYAQPSGTPLLAKESILAVRDLVAEHGTDAWFERDAKDILPAGFAHPETGETEFTKETDIFDVWFDSGATNQTVLGQWPELSYPADVYLEGGDQHRGWFNSSLMIGMAVTGKAPFKQVVTNGWTLDENGRKMSKSAMNGVAPSTVCDKYGADVLRLWVSSTDYFGDVRVGEKMLDQVSTTYRSLRGSLRFALSNLYVHSADDFDPALHAVPYAELPEIDRWALHRLNEVTRSSVQAYEDYEFQKVIQNVLGLCTADFSAFYFDVIKDRLYSYGANSPERRAAQTTLFEIASTLTRLLSPILSFTAEEVWQKLKMPNKPVSVQLADLPSDRPEFQDSELAERWSKLLGVRDEVNKALEGVKKRLELALTITADAETFETLTPYMNQLPALLLVSEVTLRKGRTNPGVDVLNNGAAPGAKCARCWVAIKEGGDDPAAICSGGCARAWRAETITDGDIVARRLEK